MVRLVFDDASAAAPVGVVPGGSNPEADPPPATSPTVGPTVAAQKTQLANTIKKLTKKAKKLKKKAKALAKKLAALG